MSIIACSIHIRLGYSFFFFFGYDVRCPKIWAIDVEQKGVANLAFAQKRKKGVAVAVAESPQ